ncbi:hypothetical protein CAP35_09045 [Chitinophagaceae bacterium IBVUCB1]|nr:hypothetical protein CAP35_09045 [Chitinophagaceae bacterium IBVUCB1]
MAILALTLIMTACKRDKNNATEVDEDTYYADDQARMDQSFNDAQTLADQAYETGNVQMKGGPSILGTCATVTRDTTSTPRKITIDFGSTNCLCNDGRLRRGKIIITYTGKYRDSGSVKTIGFDGYYVNNNQVLGSKTITNMGKNSSGQSYYSIVVNGMMILSTTGDTVKHTATRTRTWVKGESTTLLSDDEYRITGSGTNTRASGKVVNYTITSPLLIALNCNWIKEGVIAITPAGASSARTLDFGAGTCDDQATINYNGKTRTITLR